MGMRCQENGERAALFLAPSSTPWPLVKGAIAQWATGHGLAHPTLIQTFPLSLWLALLDKRGVPTCGLTAHSTPAHILYRHSLCPLRLLFEGSPPMSDPVLPTSRTDTLRNGLAGSSGGSQDCLPFAQRLSWPPPFRVLPKDAEVEVWLLFLPSLSCGPLWPGPPTLVAADPSWYMYSQLWWLDLVLNNELLKECE